MPQRLIERQRRYERETGYEKKKEDGERESESKGTKTTSQTQWSGGKYLWFFACVYLCVCVCLYIQCIGLIVSRWKWCPLIRTRYGVRKNKMCIQTMHYTHTRCWYTCVDYVVFLIVRVCFNLCQCVCLCAGGLLSVTECVRLVEA